MTNLFTRVPLLLAATALALGGATAASPGASAAGLPAQYRLPDPTAYPESITRQPGTDTIYVTSFVNGTVYRGSLHEPDLHPFIPGDAAHPSANGVKADRHGHLFVARGTAQLVDVYRASDGTLLSELSTAGFDTGSFLNDLVVTPDGSVYVNDSSRPNVFRIHQDERGRFAIERWLDLTGSVFKYQSGPGLAGANANGIVASHDGRHLLIGTTNTGRLYRIDTATKQVIEVDLGGATYPYIDGMNLSGHTLYMARNAADRVTALRLNADWSRGTLHADLADPRFAFPSSVLPANGRLLVAEFQYNRTSPTLPFTIDAIPLP
ncbi:hypothetical protein F0L68_33020 [Solihabitans fulvus]|uniref:Superoxide dismutase n=1 Tax=Solihabitans fulvus TaxID=1892852 RepID=A0A5B2WUS1_9PSEU|nr:hypothetical protein [Solihabitans fulvus]KAA2253627.1 hypothetical protein F0L68_33020 [Solihabitans fulvus]